MISVALQQFREPFLRAYREIRTEKERRNKTLSIWTTCEDRVQLQFQEFLSNDDALSRVHRDYFMTATFYEKLLLHSKHFCRAVIYPE